MDLYDATNINDDSSIAIQRGRFDRRTCVCLYLLLGSSTVGLGYGLLTCIPLMNDPASVPINERPSGPAMMGLMGMTGICGYAVLIVVTSILTRWQWPMMRLAELAFAVAVICWLALFAVILSPPNNPRFFATNLACALAGLLWHVALGWQIARASGSGPGT